MPVAGTGPESRHHVDHVGTFVSTCSVIVDLPMTVPHLPERGGDVLGAADGRTPGGGFNIVAAAARLGARVALLSTIGSGDNGRLCAEALHREGVVELLPRASADTGLCVTMTEPDGERTFVTAAGAEGVVDPAALAQVALLPADVLFVSGYDLTYPSAGPALAGWLGTAGAGTVIVDPGPLVAEIPPPLLHAVLARTSVLTVNEREAALLARRDEGSDASETACRLRALLPADAAVVLRLGARGCLVAEPDGTVTHCPGLAVEAVDSTGAGDAHAGAIGAALLRGASLVDAARDANVVAALTVTRSGPATSPTRAEVDAARAAAGID